MADTNFDVIVVGGGPGGYVAAIRAAQLGLKAAVVERAHLGGICLNWGCIPTKALLRSSEIYHTLQNLDQYGLVAKDISFDLDKVVKRSRGVAKQLSGGIGHLLKKNKVIVFDGHGKLNGGAVGARKLLVTKDGKKVRVWLASTSFWPLARGPARFLAWNLMARRSGPIERPWCLTRCQNLCW